MNLLEQSQGKIRGVLSTFDRMIIHGYYISFQNPRLLLYYLIKNDVMLKDFQTFANKETSILSNHIQKYVEEKGVKLEFISSSKIDKQEIAQKELEKRKYKKGLIIAFSVLEICNVMTVVSNAETKKLEIVSKERKCKHYYLYYNHRVFGFMFIKIQTTFPYNIGIYINGREYLSKILEKNRISYEMYNNSFSYIDDFEFAQKLADEIPNKKFYKYFNKLVNEINPLLSNFKEILHYDYFWCIDQCEYAKDINFKKALDLKAIYKKLIEETYFAFNSENIYSFFGKNEKRMHLFTQGTISSDLRVREQEYRIKFMLNNNQIKMYDKGNNLRIEVTINNPKDFKVMKEKEIITENKEMVKEKIWLPMGKSI